MNDRELHREAELARVRRELKKLISKRTLEGLTPDERDRLRQLGERERELLSEG